MVFFPWAIHGLLTVGAFAQILAKANFAGRCVAVALCCVVALALFKLRSTYRHAYGGLEIACALVFLWFALPAISSREVIFGALVTGVYVIVRGLDNVTEGFKSYHENQRKLKEVQDAEFQRVIESAAEVAVAVAYRDLMLRKLSAGKGDAHG